METNDDQRIIASILDVFAGKMPVSLLEQIAAQDVVCYMDRLRFNIGRTGLGTWFRYMHATMRERQISVDIDIGRIERIGPGRYNVGGALVTRHQSGGIETRPFAVTYLIEKGRVARVWSTRSNYVGVVGRSIILPLYVGFFYQCLRIWYKIFARRVSPPAGRKGKDFQTLF
jgi:hypothetical protein